jgi:hypothetical protein
VYCSGMSRRLGLASSSSSPKAATSAALLTGRRTGAIGAAAGGAPGPGDAAAWRCGGGDGEGMGCTRTIGLFAKMVHGVVLSLQAAHRHLILSESRSKTICVVLCGVHVQHANAGQV